MLQSMVSQRVGQSLETEQQQQQQQTEILQIISSA